MNEMDIYIFKNKNGNIKLSTCADHEDSAWSAAAHEFGRSASQLINEGYTVEKWTARRDPERFYNEEEHY